MQVHMFGVGEGVKENVIYKVKKRVVISFAVPRRKRINKLCMTLLDEGNLRQQDISKKLICMCI